MKKEFSLRGKCDFCWETTEVHCAAEYNEWICNDCDNQIISKYSLSAAQLPQVRIN